MAQLQWLGIDPAVLERLQNFVVLLPVRTTVNINTADAEVIAAVSPGLDPGAAQALVQTRQRGAYKIGSRSAQQPAPLCSIPRMSA